jgi:hypothetical protein
VIVRASDCVDPYGTARQWLPVDSEGWVTAYVTAPRVPDGYVHRQYVRCPLCDDSAPPRCTDRNCWFGPVVYFEDWEYRR